MTATNSSSAVPPPEEITGEWAWLPFNVLDSVLTQLVSLQDYLRFSTVCKRWRSTAEAHRGGRTATSHKQAPLLLVPTESRTCRWRSLYSVAQNKLLRHTLLIPYHRRCCGSSHGWLAFVEKDYFVTLYNPFTQARIFLPQIKPAPDYIETFVDRVIHDRLFAYDVKKVVLSADPSIFPTNFMVAAIIKEYGSLAVIRAGEKEWKHVRVWADHQTVYKRSIHPRMKLKDIIFHGDGTWIYGSGYSGFVARVNVAEPVKEPQLELVAPPWSPSRFNSGAYVYKYLVQSSDGRDLFMILRFYCEMEGYEFSWETRDFRVFRFRDGIEQKDLDRGMSPRFVEVNDLNGDTMFVGDNYSMAVRAEEFKGYQSDSVYYTHDFTAVKFIDADLGPHDIGVFNVKDKKFSSFYVSTPTQNRDMPPPIWIFPTIAPNLV